jgi:plastocyanin
MSSHSHDEGSKGYSPHMKGVALGILVMGISLAAIIILWTTIGYIGPDFSTQVMEQQQEWLHERYGLPPVQQLSPEMLEVPPSLRDITATGANVTTTNATTSANATTGANATTTTNATTTGNTTGTTTGATTGGGGGATTGVSIVPGSSSLTDTAYQPNPVQVSVGDTVTWTNDDTQPHTVTSGQNGQPDGKFDSSPNFNPLLAPGQTFSHTFTEAGEYPYYCALHPNQVGTVTVS